MDVADHGESAEYQEAANGIFDIHYRNADGGMNFGELLYGPLQGPRSQLWYDRNPTPANYRVNEYAPGPGIYHDDSHSQKYQGMIIILVKALPANLCQTDILSSI